MNHTYVDDTGRNIPSRKVVCRVEQRKFVVHVGQCTGCHEHVRGRHPLQISDALGAARVQWGAKTHALIAWLNKRLGLSHGTCGN